MKKSLFLLASLGAFTLTQAQTFYSKEKTEVKIMPGALLYVQGDMKVASSVTSTGQDTRTGGRKTEGYISNEGNVRVTGNLEMDNTTNGNDFVNELKSTGVYGQLIVNGDALNQGRVSSDINFTSDAFSYYSFAFPFKDAPAVIYNLANIYSLEGNGAANAFISEMGYKATAGTQQKFDVDRYKNPIFYWDNKAGEQRLDNYEQGSISSRPDLTVKPGRYYALNVGFSKHMKPNKGGFIYGTPQAQDLTVEATCYKVGSNKSYNKYGEQYGSYVVDYLNDMPAGFNKYSNEDKTVEAGNFGSNVFLFGNPFTSNINLAGDTNNTTFVPGNNNVKVVVQFGASNKYNTDVNNVDGVNNSNTQDHSSASGKGAGSFMAWTADGTGQEEALYVRPYQTFAVQLAPEATGTATFKFTQGMKTFDLNSKNPINVLLNARNNKVTNDVNQVALNLYDGKGNFTGEKTFVVASKIYEAGKKGKGIEIANSGVKDGTGIYTLQENKDGSIDAQLANEKSYINGVNSEKYIAKPIHVVLQNVKGLYTIKADLNNNLANNKNAFYFEDKKEGKVLKVGKDFSYTFNAEGTDKDRFVLYWAKTPKAELSKDLAKEVKSSSVVYKDAAGIYRVRFDRAIKKADVFVYNISGQLVNVAKAVDTASDYVVPVKGNSSIYVVKVVGDNGSVTTKKIIK